METKTQRKKRQRAAWVERFPPAAPINATSKGYTHSSSKYVNKLDRARRRFLKRMERKSDIVVRLHSPPKAKTGRREKVNWNGTRTLADGNVVSVPRAYRMR